MLSSTRFQSPEGDSGLCYTAEVERRVRLLVSFSPPKGIQVFATKWRGGVKMAQEEVSVPRRGFRSLLQGRTRLMAHRDSLGFSPPKGIQVFATSKPSLAMSIKAARQVSVPRRGFRSLLLNGNATQPAAQDSAVSVPRRGFRSLLLPSPPARLPLAGLRGFSPPKGIQVFAT